MLTAEQKIEVQMYGCTIKEMSEDLEDTLLFKFGQYDLLVMSMLSDAQEMVAYNAPTPKILESQRQLINRAKWALRTYVMNRELQKDNT